MRRTAAVRAEETQRYGRTVVGFVLEEARRELLAAAASGPIDAAAIHAILNNVREAAGLPRIK